MTTLTVDFDWIVVGRLRLEDGRPVFPPLEGQPGVYRLEFDWHDQPIGVYIGETDRFDRRAQNYRTPGAGQPTNQFVHQEIVRALSAEVQVTVSIVTTATVALDGEASTVRDLGRKTSRLIVENAAIAAVLAARALDPIHGPRLMNRPGVGEADWT